MSRYFAEINNQGTVLRVIVADSLEWCVDNLGGNWVETFMNHPTKNYAGKGHVYHSDKDDFITPKPYPSWKLNKKNIWEAPVKRKEDDLFWDENTLSWKKEK